MLSRFGLYRIVFVLHNEPPRCTISASRLVRAIDVTNRNRFRNVGSTRFGLRYVLLVMSSMARPIASDSLVDVCVKYKHFSIYVVLKQLCFILHACDN